jgi:transposase
MNKGIRFTDEFKQDVVAQVVERGYAVSEVAERLGISTKSLYTWKSQFSKSPRARSEVAYQHKFDTMEYAVDDVRNLST